MPPILATADIGSNTVHLLVAQVSKGTVTVIDNRSQWFGLGEVVAREGHIPRKTAKQVTNTVARFVQISRDHGANSCYLFATESFRRAKGAGEVADMVKAKTRLPVDVVTPEMEAELGLRGALLDCDGTSPALFVECGGGSVQLARFAEERILWDVSLALGTGTLKAGLEVVQPTTDSKVEEVRRHISATLPGGPKLDGAMRVIASGGVARGLVRALHPDGERVLRRIELEYLAWSSARLTRAQVAKRFRVKPHRAGTLMLGSLVFLELMDAAHQDEVMVSEYGVREGAVLKMAQGGFAKWRL
ncbi:MAG: hypothetical protein AB7F50_07235 [Fimbriimonadaceae bacterium]